MVEPALPSHVSSPPDASVSDSAAASPDLGLQRSLTADFQTKFSQLSPVYKEALENPSPKPRSKYALASTTDSSKDDPWANKAVLCLDGGGVRGLSSLFILQRLMGLIADYEQQEDPQNETSADSPLLSSQRIHDEMEKLSPEHATKSRVSKYLPCHYFDYIAGTSTGGLIAIMLGRLRMSVPAAIQEYRDLASRVFGERERKHLPPQVRSLFHRRNNKEDILVEQIVRMGSSRDNDEPERIFSSDATRCRTIVCSLRKNQKGGSMAPFLFRSYDRSVAVEDGSQSAAEKAELHISDVVRATVSAPDSLKSTRLGDSKFRDGGIGLNNPSIQVYQEVLSLHQQTQGSPTFDPISLFLSIGCGFSSANSSRQSSDSDNRDTLTHLYSKLERALYAISESVHRKMEELHKSSKPFSYYRFDVPDALNSIALDKFVDTPGGASTFSRIEAATESYLNTTHCQEYLKECAKNLVDRRWKRSEDTHWENFAFGTKYWCEHSGSCKFKKPYGDSFETRDELLNHFRLVHLMPPPDADHDVEIKDLIQRGRTNSD